MHVKVIYRTIKSIFCQEESMFAEVYLYFDLTHQLNICMHVLYLYVIPEIATPL